MSRASVLAVREIKVRFPVSFEENETLWKRRDCPSPSVIDPFDAVRELYENGWYFLIICVKYGQFGDRKCLR